MTPRLQHPPDDGIQAPRSAPEGGSVEITHPTSTRVLSLRDVATGRRFVVRTDADGRTRVPLPPWLRGGSVVVVVDLADPRRGTLFEVLGQD